MLGSHGGCRPHNYNELEVLVTLSGEDRQWPKRQGGAAAICALAIIPARGGSKGLPRKNVRPLCGKPLIAWTIEAALRAETVSRVVVSTDDAEIAEVSRRYGAEVVWRPKEMSDDTSPSEAALFHALEQLGVEQGNLVFLQCTAPLMLPSDIDGTVRMLEHADSAFTVTPWHRFVWKSTSEGASPVGHQKTHRPMRQQREAQYLEVGAAYAMRIEGFLQARHRFFGHTGFYEMAPERGIEIDDETDFLLAETLMRQRLNREKAARLPQRVSAFVTDFDGVLTDNRVDVDEDGKESVRCDRGDGWAMRRLSNAGIRLLVLTNESNPAVRRRCEKLEVECIVAKDSKLPALQEWLRRYGIDPDSTLYVGNDDADVPCMLYAACGVAPADAYPRAKNTAKIVLDTPGGEGCIRELAEMLFADRGGNHETTADRS